MGNALKGKYSAIAYFQWKSEGKALYGKSGFEEASKSFTPGALDVNLKDKSYIVTGANAGIGKSVVESLASKQATVHMVCRSEKRGQEAQQEIIAKTGNNSVHLHITDMSLESDVRELANKINSLEQPINGLVNNAGVMLKDRTVTKEGKECTFATMINGTFLLTTLLIPSLKKGKPSRVVDVSSGGMYNYRLDPNDLSGEWSGYDGVKAYAATKRAQVIISEFQAQKLHSDGINVNSMHPGWALTEGVEKSMPDFVVEQGDAFRTVDQGADTIVWLLISEEAANITGEFVFDRKIVRKHFPWSATEESVEDRNQLWEFCQKMIL